MGLLAMWTSCECTYCGHMWEVIVWDQSAFEIIQCPTCKDKNIKKKDSQKSKIDYYQDDTKEIEIEDDTNTGDWG